MSRGERSSHYEPERCGRAGSERWAEAGRLTLGLTTNQNNGSIDYNLAAFRK